MVDFGTRPETHQASIATKFGMSLISPMEEAEEKETTEVFIFLSSSLGYKEPVVSRSYQLTDRGGEFG